jgi:hypothetical protein
MASHLLIVTRRYKQVINNVKNGGGQRVTTLLKNNVRLGRATMEEKRRFRNNTFENCCVPYRK